MVSSLTSVIVLFGALFIHKICGNPTVWYGRRGWNDPDRKDNNSGPALKFTPGGGAGGGEGPKGEHHGSRHTRSLWRAVYKWVMRLFGNIPTGQQISERLKLLGEKMHNISQTGEGYGDLGGWGLAGHHPNPFYYYDYYIEQGPQQDDELR